jgi:hypothetical protein
MSSGSLIGAGIFPVTDDNFSNVSAFLQICLKIYALCISVLQTLHILLGNPSFANTCRLKIKF